MNLPHLHLLLNHLPILGTIISTALLSVSLIWGLDDLQQASLALFAVIALFAIPAYMSGNGAQSVIQDSPDVSMAALQLHKGAALIAFIFMEITGIFALAGSWRYSQKAKNPWRAVPSRLHRFVVLALALATAGLMAVAGNLGGDIRHAEIVNEQTVSSSIGALGVRLADEIAHLVIDTSMWVWPILEDLHFLGLILLIGTVLALNLRILGFMKQLPAAPLHRFIPWGLAGFLINVITGMLFYLGMPDFYNPNFVFQLKILTILVAGGILLLFYCTGAFRVLERLGPGDDAPLFAKIIAISSIVLWLLVIVLGRYIPFGEVS